MNEKAQICRRSIPKRLCNSCCSASNGCGGQRSISATKLRASNVGSSCSRRGLNSDSTARSSNSSATSPGSKPINTASRTGHTAVSPENNRHRALNTRQMMATRVSCASGPASGHCAVFSWASWRSKTSNPKASNNDSAAPTWAAKPKAVGGNARFQTWFTLNSTSRAHPPSHSVGVPICTSVRSHRSLIRSSKRSYQPKGTGSSSVTTAGTSADGFNALARHCVTNRADCSPAISTSNPAL